MKRGFFFLLLPFLLLTRSMALGPHEVALIANSLSEDSVHIARTYQHLRSIPGQNVIEIPVTLPENGAPASISPDGFSRNIWEPVNRILAERGLNAQILAWVYSCDFPVMLQTEPEISLMGITFLRNQLPDSSLVQKGTYVSPLFAGPGKPSADAYGSQSFDLYAEWLRADMPLPSMMLGVTGERGNTVGEILNCLKRGGASDMTSPNGNIIFVLSPDVRSRCRAWQYAPVAEDLSAMGISYERVGREPIDSLNVIGMQIGQAIVHPERHRFLPGAMAEHLTSASAVFHTPHQTKLSAWIRAGATATAGTVTEPYSIPSKFPHSRFFIHYIAGCTMIESFYQSIGCPLQILLVGEPLASPWAPTTDLSIDGLGSGDVSGYITVSASTSDRLQYGKYTYILNGKVIHRGERLALDTRTLSNGLHTLRVVAYRVGLVRSQVHSERSFRVRNVAKSDAR